MTAGTDAAASGTAVLARIIRERHGITQVDAVAEDGCLVLWGYGTGDRIFIAAHDEAGQPDPKRWQSLPVFRWRLVA